ncbi:hypothetical protein BH23GEM1_BH23GEM1_01670 [soil metagenome]
MLCAASCGWSSLAVAQAGVYFGAGGARVRYGDSVQVSAATVGASAYSLTGNTSFSATLSGSMAEQSNWTTFGTAQGSVLTPALGFARGELHGSGSLTSYGAGSGSGRLLGGGRLHLSGRSAGAWLGASAGSVKDPVGWRSVKAGEVGAWLQTGSANAQAVVMPVRIAGGLRYTDVEGTIRFDNSRLELMGVAGMRSGIAGYDDTPDPWASLNATVWLLRAVGITAGIGSYPADPGQDFPTAKYITLGVRVAPMNTRRSPVLLSADVLGGTRGAPPAMTVTAGPGAVRTITFRAPAARTVEIMGDFTDWTPVQMSAAQPAGTWAISLPVSAGVHQVNVRVDGGSWIVPAGLPVIKDEFGGSVGILLVP